MYTNHPIKRMSRPQIVRQPHYERTPPTAIEIVNAFFDRIERIPRLASREYNRFVFWKRVQGALFLLFALVALFAMGYSLHKSQTLSSSPAMQRMEPNEQDEQERFPPSKSRVKARS